MKTWTPKQWIALAITTAVCSFIVIFVIRIATAPIGSVPENTSNKVFELVTFLAGIMSGYLLGKGHEEEEKKEEPPTIEPPKV